MPALRKSTWYKELLRAGRKDKLIYTFSSVTTREQAIWGYRQLSSLLIEGSLYYGTGLAVKNIFTGTALL